MLYQVIHAMSKQQLAWGLTLNEAHRFVRERGGCYYIPAH